MWPRIAELFKKLLRTLPESALTDFLKTYLEEVYQALASTDWFQELRAEHRKSITASLLVFGAILRWRFKNTPIIGEVAIDSVSEIIRRLFRNERREVRRLISILLNNYDLSQELRKQLARTYEVLDAERAGLGISRAGKTYDKPPPTTDRNFIKSRSRIKTIIALLGLALGIFLLLPVMAGLHVFVGSETDNIVARSATAGGLILVFSACLVLAGPFLYIWHLARKNSFFVSLVGAVWLMFSLMVLSSLTNPVEVNGQMLPIAFVVCTVAAYLIFSDRESKHIRRRSVGVAIVIGFVCLKTMSPDLFVAARELAGSAGDDAAGALRRATVVELERVEFDPCGSHTFFASLGSGQSEGLYWVYLHANNGPCQFEFYTREIGRIWTSPPRHPVYDTPLTEINADTALETENCLKIACAKQKQRIQTEAEERERKRASDAAERLKKITAQANPPKVASLPSKPVLARTPPVSPKRKFVSPPRETSAVTPIEKVRIKLECQPSGKAPTPLGSTPLTWKERGFLGQPTRIWRETGEARVDVWLSTTRLKVGDRLSLSHNGCFNIGGQVIDGSNSSIEASVREGMTKNALVLELEAIKSSDSKSWPLPVRTAIHLPDRTEYPRLKFRPGYSSNLSDTLSRHIGVSLPPNSKILYEEGQRLAPR